MTALALTRLPSAPFEDVAAPIPKDFVLESGDLLPDTHVRLRCFGPREAPQILALGGISAGLNVCGEDGWWRETISDHGAVDLNRFGLIGLDFAPAGNHRVRLTPQDQARLIVIALGRLRVPKLHGFVGASYGGLVGLALAALAPERIERLCVISAAHRPAAQALAWRGVQRRIVAFGLEHGDAAGGLALARQLAMITYRTADEFEARFGAGIDAEGRGGVDRYLEARGETYAEAGAPRRWLTLSESIDRAFVDPVDVRVAVTLVGCLDDQLVPISLVRELAERLPHLRGFHTLPSIYGHDAFLKEPARIAPIIRKCLEAPAHG
ncbi:homoserine O-succinyltransferase MetX [Terricaulis silvestris]|uniref:Homoserine O-acetyltransferase n=1 Tax=Terricaulis silvestris TaxID=2686094 RepID=A0A6I6MY51_9CAUL|nr:homoserine O-succinyltransferase [Terricaulis silvestris]QGZ96093.1 Homoserine O-acetyltransferase [Terricaulis silvestris]